MRNITDKTFRRNKGSNATPVLLIGGAIVVLIIIIALVAFLILKSGEPSSGPGASNLANYYPENTLFYAELNLTPEKFEEIQKLSGDSLSLEKMAESLQKAAKNPQEAAKTMMVFNALNKTLEPKLAMGQWGLPEGAKEPENLLITAILKNNADVSSMIDELTEGEVKFEQKNIDGQDFYLSDDGKGGYTVQGNVLLLSDKVETMQSALEQGKNGNKNILNNPEAVNVLNNLQSNRFLTVLIDAYNLNIASQASSAMPISGNDESMGQVMKTLSFMGFGLDIHGDVMEGKFYAPYDLSSITDATLKNTLESLFKTSSQLNAPKVLPGDTCAFISISGVSYMIQTTLQFMDPKSQQEYNQQKQMVQMFTGLDLETDVLPLFSEEFTFAGRVVDEDLEPVIVLTKKPESTQVLSKVVGALTKMDPTASITQKDSGGAQLSLISSGNVPFQVGYGAIDEVIALGKGTSLEYMAKKESTLADSQTYKTMSKYIPSTVALAMFIDFDNAVKAKKFFSKSPEDMKNLEKMNENMSAFILTASNKDNKAIEGSVLVKFKK